MDHFFGLTKDHIKDIGKIIWCMDQEKWYIQMVENIKVIISHKNVQENSSRIYVMVLVLFFLIMEPLTQDNGNKIKNMD